MNTVNLVLTIVLSSILGFLIGSAYGQAKMKVIFTDMIDKMTNGLKSLNGKHTNKEDQNSHE